MYKRSALQDEQWNGIVLYRCRESSNYTVYNADGIKDFVAYSVVIGVSRSASQVVKGRTMLTLNLEKQASEYNHKLGRKEALEDIQVNASQDFKIQGWNFGVKGMGQFLPFVQKV